MLNNYKAIVLVLFLGLISLKVLPQGLTVQNPSFEGTSQAHVLPGPWNACFGSPDTQPGQWGFTQPASDQNTYISMLHAGSSSGGYSEGGSQQLSGCMTAGETYTFTIDLAFSSVYNTAEPGNCYGSFEIYGGNGLCGTDQLLWQSGQITHTNWQTYSVSITPTSNWCYITFRPYWISACSGYINVMADNIQPIVPASPGIEITSPTMNEDVDCTFLVTGTTDSIPVGVGLQGNFIGGQVVATVNGTNWQAWVSYPPNFSGTETIYAGAQFADGSTAVDSVTFNVVLPVADFTFTNECLNTPITFTDQSTFSAGNIVSWSWDFGDGNTSVQQSPTHQYDQPGVYDVMLTVESDDGCTHSVTQQVEAYAEPEVDFDFTTACLGQTTAFSDITILNGATVNTWAWDFGDGNTSNLQNPTNDYLVPNTYNVQLTITTTDGCTGSVTYPVTVNPLPTADFSFTDECYGVSNSFTDLSTTQVGNIVGWTWDFDDGNTSNQQNPTHLYGQDGVYNVKLIADGGGGCIDSITQQVAVFPQPIADFVAFDVCHGNQNTFTDNSTISINGLINDWAWDFGDGPGTSTQQNPTYTYPNPGNYTVTLTVNTADNCPSTHTTDIQVNITPEASYTFGSVCEDGPMTFTNTSNSNGGTLTNFHWDFGDFDFIPAIPNSTSTVENPDFTYFTPGTYNVTFTITAAGGCVDDTVQQIEVFPKPNANFTFDKVCFGEVTTFTDGSNVINDVIDTWLWDMGDGNTLNTQNPTHNYGQEGLYSVELLVTTSNGCQDSITQPVRVFATPIAEFSGIDVCLNTPTDFTNETTIPGGAIDVYDWDFDDGNTSDDVSPSNTYVDPGAYDVTLTTTSDSGCVDMIEHTVNVYPYPDPSFTSDIIDGCEPLDVQFIDQSTISSGNVVSYTWKFGDGNTSTQSSPLNTYQNDGSYDVTLTVTSDQGCDTTITINKYITVYPLPVAGFIHDPTVVSVFDPTFDFYDESIGADSVVIYDFGDGIFAEERNPVHTYQDSGFYMVTQYVYTVHGCGDTITDILRVNPEFTLYIPNAFTPNSDGYNEVFRPQGIGMLDFTMRIYTRWGEQIFFTKEIGGFWDGTINNGTSEVKEDVYIYNIHVLDVNYEEYEFNGHVTLIR